jgi:prolyl-tRNA synthetase
MGCYGIGVNRIMATAIELHNDKKGIIWPMSIAPFQVIVIPINYKEENIRKITDNIYEEVNQAGIETLLDDRDESAGVKFNDAELIGIPFSIVIGDRGLKKGIVEIKIRNTGEIIEVKKEQLKDKILSLILT